MSEEVVAPEVPATETPVAVTEDQNTALPENSESGTETQEQETTKPQETEEQKRSKYQRRIDRKNADIAAARTEARMYKERLEQLEAQRNPQQRDEVPTLDKFDNFDDYMAARVAYETEKVVESRLSKVQQQEAQRKAVEAHQSVMTSWQDKQAAAVDKYPDFADVVGESEAPTTPQMSQAIIESDAGADILYYLAQHPDEAKAIARLSPIRQITEIGKLEIKVSTPVVRKPSETPPPVTPVGAKAKAERDPDKMPYKEWVKWREEQAKKR